MASCYDMKAKMYYEKDCDLKYLKGKTDCYRWLWLLRAMPMPRTCATAAAM